MGIITLWKTTLWKTFTSRQQTEEIHFKRLNTNAAVQFMVLKEKGGNPSGKRQTAERQWRRKSERQTRMFTPANKLKIPRTTTSHLDNEQSAWALGNTSSWACCGLLNPEHSWRWHRPRPPVRGRSLLGFRASQRSARISQPKR